MRNTMHRVARRFSGATLAAVIAAGGCAAGGGGDRAPTSRIAPDPPRAPSLTPQTSGTTNRLQAVSPVDARVVWASGLGGTYAVTRDGGTTWRSAVVPGAEALEFRDVQAVSERIAYLLAAGPGARSRIYKTVDGGASWSLEFQNQDPGRFYDCFAWFSAERAIAMADSQDGRFPAIHTTDGERWAELGDRLPPAQPGESAFAASGTCIATHGDRRAWIATGGAPHARVLATIDGGQTWTSHATPIVQGTPSSGGFSVAFRDHRNGILAGGDLAAPTARSPNNFARSRDGGATWTLATAVPVAGAVFGASYAIARDAGDAAAGDDRARAAVTVVATGPGGAAWSSDEGDSWTGLDGVANYWAVAFADAHTGWLVGTEGRILRLDF